MCGIERKLMNYIKKLEKWDAPKEFGRASGNVTKKIIVDELKKIVENS